MPGRRLPGRFNGGHSVSYTYYRKHRRLTDRVHLKMRMRGLIPTPEVKVCKIAVIPV
jgi:hypothetical protein